MQITITAAEQAYHGSVLSYSLDTTTADFATELAVIVGAFLEPCGHDQLTFRKVPAHAPPADWGPALELFNSLVPIAPRTRVTSGQLAFDERLHG